MKKILVLIFLVGNLVLNVVIAETSSSGNIIPLYSQESLNKNPFQYDPTLPNKPVPPEIEKFPSFISTVIKLVNSDSESFSKNLNILFRYHWFDIFKIFFVIVILVIGFFKLIGRFTTSKN